MEGEACHTDRHENPVTHHLVSLPSSNHTMKCLLMVLLTPLLTSRSLAFVLREKRLISYSRLACVETLKMVDYKRVKYDETPSDKVIGTHSGSFQADEAMGVWMLRQVPAYRNSKVVRSRDLKVLEDLGEQYTASKGIKGSNILTKITVLKKYTHPLIISSLIANLLPPLSTFKDIVIDVGGIYDHSKLRYDHHQRGYDERFDQGKDGSEGRCTKLSASGLVYRHYGKEIIKSYYPSLSGEHLEIAYKKIYNSLLVSSTRIWLLVDFLLV